MCGIAGFLAEGRAEARAAILHRMIRTLVHRGPDDEDCYQDDHVALGARRLVVIDRNGGRQPMSNDAGTVWAIHNGEIYNFQALREHLASRGCCFRTRSDTEVLLRAYELYGEDCVQHFDGMFACAIWDARTRTLLLARDRIGEKPLYYFAGPQAFVFGSELRALLAHPEVPRTLDPASVARYLAFEYVPDPYSILAGIAKLMPGHVLTVSPGRAPRVTPYWSLRFAPDRSATEAEWVERLRSALDQSVRERLVSDVPVGVFLSGGLDSSAIAATAARVSPGTKLKTFSVGFAERSYDERPFAREVARQYDTEHHEIVFAPEHVLVLLDDIGRLLDEPLVDPSFMPLYLLSRLARHTVTVVLSGDGGDELFCGYPTFLAERAIRWVQRLPHPIVATAARLVDRLPPSAAYGSVDFLLRQFFRGLPHRSDARTQLLLGGVPAWEQSTLWSPEVREVCAGFDPYSELMLAIHRSGIVDSFERLIYQHVRFYLAGQNLATVDRASMACGLEVRAPFLSTAIVDLASRIPSGWKVRGWTTKYIVKRALRDRLPADVLRRRKQGFGVPLAAWLRGPLRPVLDERLARERVARQGLFDAAAVRRLVDEHVAGVKDHRKVLWALLMLDAWCDEYRPTMALRER